MDRKIFWIFALSSTVYFTQGIEGLPSQGLFYYLKEARNFSPEKIMYLASFTSLAWIVKPFIGYLIDNFLSKRAWIFLSLAMDVLAVLALGLLSVPVPLLVALLLFNSTNTAFRDVSVDGVMCVEGKKYNLTGKIQSVQWISISVAGLIIGILGGYIAEKSGYKLAFLCLIPVYFLIAFCAYFYREDRQRPVDFKKRALSHDLKKLFSNKRLLIVAVFIFLYKYSPSFGTPLFFIQRDTFKWSKLWIGTLDTIAMAFSIAGSIFYYKFSQRINIKKWLYIFVFLGAVLTLSYLYYTPVSAVIYSLLYGFIGMFVFLMIMDFMAKNTMAGFEATSFALLCSFSNLALYAGN
ncbi:MAG: MFS transporter, partial [Candidatus Omnitrophica bacterium]|nr:MFS transporter [Candidatus Omnitrophota bacterium]